MMKRLIPIAIGFMMFISTETTSQLPSVEAEPKTETTIETEIVEVIEVELPTVAEPQETETEVEETEVETETESQDQYISLGKFLITAYCSCYKCCGEYALNRPVDENGNEIVKGSIGEVLTPKYSIAVDPSVIPYGTEVMFGGNIYKAQDCGGDIKQKRIDLYFNDHQEALNWGKKWFEVFIVKESED